MINRFAHISFTFFFSSVSLLFSSISHAGDLKLSKAEKVGMSAQRLFKLNELGAGYIESGQYSGVVTMVARKGKVVHLNAEGNFSVDNKKPLQTDTLFRIYSMTKPITAVAAMILYEEGKFHLNDPVSKYIPEFSDLKILKDGEQVVPQKPMTVRQLFTHTSGLSYGFATDNKVDAMYRELKPLDREDLNGFLQEVAKIPLRFEPGKRYQYSVSYDVLGVIVERLAEMPLDEFLATRIFQPLGMKDTFFEVPADKLDRLAGDQYWDVKTEKVTDVPAQAQRNFSEVTLFSGGGGLVSTASDYMRFAQMILNKGSYKGERILGPKTVEFMSENQMTNEVREEGVGEFENSDLHAGQNMSLGFGVVTKPALMPATSSKGELSWSGAAGTKFWIDPQEEIIGIAMVQQYLTPWPLRFDMKVATYQAVTILNSAVSAN